MIESTTACVFYRENPHIDARQRGRECAEIIVRTVAGEVRPVQWLETPPLVINIVKQYTGMEPLKTLMDECEELIRQPGILSASVIQGYPYADVEEMGMSFLVVADRDRDRARDEARRMAGRAWELRERFQGGTLSPTQALHHAMRAQRGPIVLMDVGDNIGGGSPADSTILLAEARRLGATGLLQTLYDPEAVRACVRAGAGGRLTVAVGAKTDDRHGRPVEVTGTVRSLHAGTFEDTRPTHGGQRYFDQGLTAVLDTGDGHTLVLNSKRCGNTSIEQMYSLGVRPEGYQIVVAKGVQSPRPAYEPIAAEIVLVNTPGVTTADLSFFSYERRRRPLYPFEAEAQYG
jgi:microcystin degradation protein MlrC